METTFPFYRQQTNSDSGLVCLKMVAAYYNKAYSIDSLQHGLLQSDLGLPDLRVSAKRIGFRTLQTRLSFRQLTEESPLPCILPWNKTGFAVFYGKQQSRWRWLAKHESTTSTDRLIIADPTSQLITITKEAFLNAWTGGQDTRGHVLLMDPSPEFEIASTQVSQPLSKSFSPLPVQHWIQQASEFFPVNKRLYQYIHNILL